MKIIIKFMSVKVFHLVNVTWVLFRLWVNTLKKWELNV